MISGVCERDASKISRLEQEQLANTIIATTDPVIVLNSNPSTSASTGTPQHADPRERQNWRSGEDKPTMKREEDTMQIVNATSHPRLKTHQTHRNKDLFVPVGWNPGDKHETEEFLRLKPSEDGDRDKGRGEEERRQKMPVDCWVALDSRVEVPRGDLVEYRCENLSTNGGMGSSQQYELEEEDTDRLRKLVSNAMVKRAERQARQAEVNANVQRRRGEKEAKRQEEEKQQEVARARKQAAMDVKATKEKRRQDTGKREWRLLDQQGTHGDCPLPKADLGNPGADKDIATAQRNLEDMKRQNETLQQARELNIWRTTEPNDAKTVLEHKPNYGNQPRCVMEPMPKVEMSEKERGKAEKAQRRAVLVAGSQSITDLHLTSKNLQHVRRETRLEENDANDLEDIHRCIDDLEPAVATLNQLCEQLAVDTVHQPSQPSINPSDVHAESEVVQAQHSMGTGTLNADTGLEEDREMDASPVDEVAFMPTRRKRGFSGFCKRAWDKRPGKTGGSGYVVD